MNGFGFSFNFGANDDNDRNDHPFGNLGDMLNQFGQMISGVGSDLNAPGAQGSVNYAVAERIARQKVGADTPPTQEDKDAAAEAVRLAELWLDGATFFPVSGNRVVAWSPMVWLTETIPSWGRMVEPVSEHFAQAQTDALPEEAREMMGPMITMVTKMNSMNQGMNLGNALADLSVQTFSASDFGIQLAPEGVTALLPGNLRKAAASLDVSFQDMLLYLAAREAARQRLFRHVPWLREQLVSSVEEYAVGLVIDTSHVEERLRELNIDPNNPQSFQEAMGSLQGEDLSPRITSRNEAATVRLETLLALIEGWVDVVIDDALGAHMPSVGALNQAWENRRASGGTADKVLSDVVGIEVSAPDVEGAANLWRRVTTAVGAERRDKVWEHPDFLPTAEDVQSPAAFIDTLLDEVSMADFDPIGEITQYEERLKSGEQEEDPESKES